MADLKAVGASEEIECNSHSLTTVKDRLSSILKVEWREKEDDLPGETRWKKFLGFLEKKADVAEGLIRDRRISKSKSGEPKESGNPKRYFSREL